MKRICLVIACLVVFCGQRAVAQVLTCDPQAYKNYDVSSSSDEYRAAYLQSIDRETFDMLKAEGSSGGGFKIAGFGFSADTTYETFSLRRERILKYTKYSADSKTSRNYVRNSFDGFGAKAYNKCLEALVELNKRGLFLNLLDSTDKIIIARVHWRPTSSAPVTLNLAKDVQLIGSSTPKSGLPLPQTWEGEVERDFTLTRVPSKELSFVINLGGLSNSFLLPPKPVIKPFCRGNDLLSSNATVTVSSEPSGAKNVVDGSTASSWNSRTYAPQWVMINLGFPQTVHYLNLVVAQHPKGKTRHVISGILSNGKEVELKVEEGITESNNELTVFIPEDKREDIRAVRVKTTESPSWVAWREIKVYGCPY